ncbi:MAG: MBL fold metallo-hydrolase [Deltaproteobacteria bacterium]|nr:MBL fold metallo-hydrolase [Myxococcales bacterium]MDP3215222.1 MBL fold metallo-hydrolase [Deltaproteobacteria bacterium]
MLKLRVIQARAGDCLLLMHDDGGTATRVLIDGGMKDIYRDHLRPVLEALAADGEALDLVVLSHVDSDHVRGLNTFFSELRDQRDEGQAPFIAVGGLWHNAFSETEEDGTITPRLRALEQMAGVAGVSAVGALSTVGEGSILRGLAVDLRVPINAVRQGRPILAGKPVEPVMVGGVKVTIVGPTKANLDAIRAEWKAWLDEKAAAPSSLAGVELDDTAPNLSSLQMLVEADGRRMLLTGDGRGDHLLDALDTLGLLDANGAIEVDVLKLPHHGSIRNVPADFFDRVIARTYVASANGQYGNPDVATLERLLASARSAGRTFELVVTNRAAPVETFVRAHPPARNGYTLTVLAAGEHFVDVTP